jgi:hypothetical protein
MRISLSTTYWPMIWPSPEQVTLSVYPGSGSLELPVRPAKGEEESAEPLGPAESALPMKVRQLEPPPCRNTITRDLVRGRTEVLAERGSGYFVIEENEIQAGLNVIERMSITEAKPLSALTEVISYARTGRSGLLINVAARSRLTGDAVEFTLESSLEVRENEHVVFERTWTHRMPRGFL